MRLMRPLLIVFAVFYLAYHVMHGERGLFALIRETHEHEVLQTQLHDTKMKRLAMEQRVSHFRDDALDLDLLDEQMRRMMGMMQPNEVMVLLH
ncbi:MAG: FtsB family cell division protein [Rickettsiales bacterium]